MFLMFFMSMSTCIFQRPHHHVPWQCQLSSSHRNATSHSGNASNWEKGQILLCSSCRSCYTHEVMSIARLLVEAIPRTRWHVALGPPQIRLLHKRHCNSRMPIQITFISLGIVWLRLCNHRADRKYARSKPIAGHRNSERLETGLSTCGGLWHVSVRETRFPAGGSHDHYLNTSLHL